MFSYEEISANLDRLKTILKLPSSNILSLSIRKKEGFVADILIEYITEHDVFCPVTEVGHIYIDANGICSSEESKIVISAIGFNQIRDIKNNICNLLLKI
jgi:hypothetical protein